MTALDHLAHVGIFDVTKPVPALDDGPCIVCAFPHAVAVPSGDRVFGFVGRLCTACGSTYVLASEMLDTAPPPTQAADSPDYIHAAYRDDAR